METIQKAIVSTLANGHSFHDSLAPAADSGSGNHAASFVSRILQVALGLFVTTVDLPSLSTDLQPGSTISFDCDFSLPCRWSSIGGGQDRWRLAKGEPDSLLWLAATGTMVQPAEPFALLESREGGGRLGDMLCSQLINCQEGSSLFSFTYWTIGNSDLEICLLDEAYNRFNCTGWLQTQVQPGKVALRIPPVERSFHVAIIPNPAQGILVIDDIKYDARYCHEWHRGILLSTRSSPIPPLATTASSPSVPSIPYQTSLIQTWSSPTQPSSITGPIVEPSSSPSMVFTSPVPSSYVRGPISTASPLPNPFTAGPSLPMGPLILPPLLPGPPAGIVNPFVVAPMIPPTTTFPVYTMPSSVQPPQIQQKIVDPTSPPSSMIIVTAATNSGIEPTAKSGEEIDEEEEEENGDRNELEKLIAAITKPTTAKPHHHLFSSTIIPIRTRPTLTPTIETRMPMTGIANIIASPTTVKPLTNFELLIVGNKTRPLFDRRLGKITEKTEDLLCDFGHNFPCLWGSESGRWAIVEKGAIPSLDEEFSGNSAEGSENEEAPNYPAAVVIQGSAMLSSDPLRCQSGEGKLLFRYWTNGRVLVQVCAMGWAVDSAKIQCVEEVAEHNRLDPSSLAIFELPDPIHESFTLNVVPIWDKHAHNNYLLIDEIAYIGECNLTALNEIDEEESRELGIGKGIEKPSSGTAHGKKPLAPGSPFIPPHFTIRPTTTQKTTTTTTESTTTEVPSTTMATPIRTFMPISSLPPPTFVTIGGGESSTDRPPSTIFPHPPFGLTLAPPPMILPPIIPIPAITMPQLPPVITTMSVLTTTTTTITNEERSTTTQSPMTITTTQHHTRRPTSSRRPHHPRPRPIPRPHTRQPLIINPIEPNGQQTTQMPMPLPIELTRRPFTQQTRRPPPFIEETPATGWLTSSRRPGTRYPFYPSTPTPPIYRSTTPPWGPSRELPTAPIEWMTSTRPKIDGSSEEHSTIYPGIDPIKKKRPSPSGTTKDSFTIPYTTTQRYKPTTAPVELNYCKLLNCDFNENACHYLNHGLTRVPWTLRTKGYGFPLNRNTDLRPTAANGQFVSCVLGPGDFAILESPRFNLTDGINVLLFQYFRPTHSSTIRLCLGTRYTKPLRTVSAFLQCPPILRSVTSKNTPKWNSVHIQLPPGTSHFYLVAHNLDRSAEKTAIAIDNIRVAICDPRATYDPEDSELVESAMETRRSMIVPSVRRKNVEEEIDSHEVYEDLTDVNEEDNERK